MTTLEVVPDSVNLRDMSEAEAARELVRMAREQGLSLTGPDGLLEQLTKTVIGTALDEEMTEHLGYEKHDAVAEETVNSRNGTRPRTVLTETTGPVEIEVPRDRDGSFEPVIVRKRQRRLNGVDEVVLSRYAKGLRARGDQRAFRRDLRCLGIERDHFQDHRQGARGDDRMAEPAAR